MNNFLGDEDKAGITFGVHVAAIAAKQGFGAFMPGPGWLYTATAIGWDVWMVGQSAVDCLHP